MAQHCQYRPIGDHLPSAGTLSGFCVLRLTPYAVPPTVRPSMRSVGWPTPTGTL